MNKFKLMLALLAAPSMVLASCGDNPAVVDKKVTKVSVSCSKTSLEVGASVTAKANVTAEGGAETTVTWSSSNQAVATVSSSGKITAKGVGTATITATSTFDTSKSGTVTITVVKADWSATDKAFMETYLGEVLPYVAGGFTWTDEYLEDYGCLSAEASGNYAKAAYDTLKADPDFTDEGTYTDEGVTIYCLSKDYVLSSDYYLAFEIYFYSNVTSIDVYMEAVEYDEWPTEIIANSMTECGLEGTVPAYDAGDYAGYTASVQELDDGSPCVYITVTDYDEESLLGASDYVDSLNPDDYLIIQEGYDYFVSPKDKAFTMYVYDLQSYYYYGFEIIVCDYIPDLTISINEGFDLIEVGKDLQLTLTKGIDVTDTTVITFESSDATIATVSTEGKVTGVSKGEVTISAKVDGEVVSQAMFYVVDSIRTEWSNEEKAEFDKIHAGLGDKIPFDKYFDSVEYDADDKAVYVDSSMYSMELDAYREALVADGWTDILAEEFGELADLAYMFGYPFMFEKDIEIDGTHYFVGMDVYAGYLDEDEAFVQDFEGYLSAVVYDDYLYDYSEAIAAVKAYFTEFEIETTADFPDSLPGSHYSVSFDDDYGSIDFYAYDVGSITIDDVVTALNEKNWDVEKLHQDSYVDEETGKTVEAYDYIYGTSTDEVLEIEGYVEDGMVILYIYVPSNMPKQLMDVDDLQDGDQIYIASLDSDLGLGAYNGKKNFASVSIYDEGTDSYSFDDCTMFTVTDNGDGTWGLEDQDGNVYGADGSKNIKIDGATSYDWTIEVDAEGNATIGCAGWVLMLNETTTPAVYKTYASSFEGTAVQIFVI